MRLSPSSLSWLRHTLSLARREMHGRSVLAAYTISTTGFSNPTISSLYPKTWCVNRGWNWRAGSPTSDALRTMRMRTASFAHVEKGVGLKISAMRCRPAKGSGALAAVLVGLERWRSEAGEGLRECSARGPSSTHGRYTLRLSSPRRPCGESVALLQSSLTCSAASRAPWRALRLRPRSPPACSPSPAPEGAALDVTSDTDTAGLSSRGRRRDAGLHSPPLLRGAHGSVAASAAGSLRTPPAPPRRRRNEPRRQAPSPPPRPLLSGTGVCKAPCLSCRGAGPHAPEPHRAT